MNPENKTNTQQICFLQTITKNEAQMDDLFSALGNIFEIKKQVLKKGVLLNHFELKKHRGAVPGQYLKKYPSPPSLGLPPPDYYEPPASGRARAFRNIYLQWQKGPESATKA